MEEKNGSWLKEYLRDIRQSQISIAEKLEHFIEETCPGRHAQLDTRLEALEADATKRKAISALLYGLATTIGGLITLIGQKLWTLIAK